jgi:2-(1,2-epoxy-1,2-dihydrophenyl)acetyl-CoA isomerase
MLDELLDAVTVVGGSSARVLLVAGEGRAFCSGADLRSLPRDVDLSDRNSVIGHMTKWRDLISGIRALPIPTVAAVQGPAYGGGANLALACDIVVATQSAVFCQSYVDRGVSTDLGGSYVLSRLVGQAKARYLLLTGATVSGLEAAAMGMVARAVPDEDLDRVAAELADELAAKDPAALRAMREVLEAGGSGTLDDALHREGEKVADLLTSSEFRARLAAFMGESES